MKKIFISYRRAETEYAAGALGRELRTHFGEDQVFRDKEDVGAGVSWKKQVLHEIGDQSALLVLISKGWADCRDGSGQRRLDNPEDSVRIEICDGIRDRATIIPILLENAEMPAESDLPQDLKVLADLNARRLRDGDWPYDLGRICGVLEATGFKPLTVPAAGPKGTSRGMSVMMILSYIISAFALIGFSDMQDRAAQWGFAVIGVFALLLAMPVFMSYRRGKMGNKWGALGAVAFGAVVTLGHIGGGIVAEPEDEAPPPSATAAATTDPAP